MTAETAKPERATGGPCAGALETRRVVLALAGLFFLNLLLRVFYLRFDFVNGDEAVRALTATRILDGAQLYTEIVTDKPPGTTFFYALVFALFGRSMDAVHIAAALWNFATAMVVAFAAASFYNSRTALWAALAFVYFSTNYLTPDMMAANTEMLMVLPYTASFFVFIKAHTLERGGLCSAALLVAAGLMTGAAALFKQVAVFNLAFFALYEIFDAITGRDSTTRLAQSAKRAIARLLFVAAGFVIVTAGFVAWLMATDALDSFWRYTFVLGTVYVDALPAHLWWRFLIGRVFSYVLFNAALWSLAVWAVRNAAAEFRKRNREINTAAFAHARFDIAIAMWAVVSLSGVFTGGRFFGHYFIQVLPALSLLGGRGVVMLINRLNTAPRSVKARAAATAIVILFIFGFVRFHHRTAILAYESVTGRQTRWSEDWGMTTREREAEAVARVLRERITPGEPLYVWDYGLDIYWRSGASPASRYLTPYYITGRFPEISTDPAPVEEPFWPEERANLIEDLKRTRPRFIIDVSGSLLSLPYRQLVDFVKENYRYEENISTDPARPFRVYSLR